MIFCQADFGLSLIGLTSIQRIAVVEVIDRAKRCAYTQASLAPQRHRWERRHRACWSLQNATRLRRWFRRGSEGELQHGFKV